VINGHIILSCLLSNSPPTRRTWYLPHQSTRIQKKRNPDKVRVAFDASDTLSREGQGCHWKIFDCHVRRLNTWQLCHVLNRAMKLPCFFSILPRFCSKKTQIFVVFLIFFATVPLKIVKIATKHGNCHVSSRRALNRLGR
jgi:hypothetical protein